jgi:hypothetical protein
MLALEETLNVSRVLTYKFRSFSSHIVGRLVDGSRDRRFDVTILRLFWEKHRGIGHTDLRFFNRRLAAQHRLLLKSLGHTHLERGVRSRGARGGLGGDQAAKFAPIFGIDPLNQTALDLLTHQNIVQEINGVQVVRENVRQPLTPTMVKVPRESRCEGRKSRLAGKEIVFCTYTRNRAKLTIEWIQWHRILGVSRFYVFDDGSSDNLHSDLLPLIEAGIVHYPTSTIQVHPLSCGWWNA